MFDGGEQQAAEFIDIALFPTIRSEGDDVRKVFLPPLGQGLVEAGVSGGERRIRLDYGGEVAAVGDGGSKIRIIFNRR